MTHVIREMNPALLPTFSPFLALCNPVAIADDTTHLVCANAPWKKRWPLLGHTVSLSLNLDAANARRLEHLLYQILTAKLASQFLFLEIPAPEAQRIALIVSGYEHDGKRYAVLSGHEHCEPVHSNSIEHKQIENALARSQQRLALQTEFAPIGVIEWNSAFCVQAWNPAAARIFGYSQEEAMGQHASILLSPQVRPFVNDVFARLMSHTGGQHSVNENLTRDGRTIICEWHNTPLVDEKHQPIGVLSLVHDVTERKQLEDHLRRTTEELQRQIAEAQRETAQKSELLAALDKQLALINGQHQQIIELSAPLLEVWDGTLAVPLIGPLSEQRMREICERLLGAISTRRVRRTIIDLTGTDQLDAPAAARLVAILRGIRLLGTEGILTGIRPSVAQSLVQLDVELPELAIRPTLKEALRDCMQRLSSFAK